MVAFDCAQRRSEEAAHIERPEDRIRSRRIVFSAVPKLMRAQGLSEEDAFTLIRQAAMRHRTTIERLSAEIIALGRMPRGSRTPESVAPHRLISDHLRVVRAYFNGKPKDPTPNTPHRTIWYNTTAGLVAR